MLSQLFGLAYCICKADKLRSMANAFAFLNLLAVALTVASTTSPIIFLGCQPENGVRANRNSYDVISRTGHGLDGRPS